MKKIFYTLIIGCSAMTLLSSCGNDETIVANPTEIPQAIQANLDKNFAGNPVLQVIKEKNLMTNEYEIILKDATSLKFDGKNELKEIKSQKPIPLNLIPASIVTYVQANFTNIDIIEWEKDTKDQKVKLDNQIELKFDQNGNFIKIDN